MKITESRINEIIKETINDVIEFGDSKPSNPYKNINNGTVTPYTPQEREQNFKGIGNMGNPSYNAFKAWREEGIRRGIPSRELSWSKYIEQKQ